MGMRCSLLLASRKPAPPIAGSSPNRRGSSTPKVPSWATASRKLDLTMKPGALPRRYCSPPGVQKDGGVCVCVFFFFVLPLPSVITPSPLAVQAQQETQKAALRYERAVSMHNAAREMVFVAEQGVMADKNRLDPTWQEMLNHATCKVRARGEGCLHLQGGLGWGLRGGGWKLGMMGTGETPLLKGFWGVLRSMRQRKSGCGASGSTSA